MRGGGAADDSRGWLGKAVYLGELWGQDGEAVDPCADYTAWGKPCPSVVNIGKT